MNKRVILLIALFIITVTVVLLFKNNVMIKSSNPGEIIQLAANRQAIEAIFGRKGTVQDQVLKLTFPRNDLHVTIGAIPIDPGFALTSYANPNMVKKESNKIENLLMKEQRLINENK